MAQSESADGDKHESEAGQAQGASRAAAHDNLPMVLSPKLGAGDDEAVDDSTAEPAAAGAAAASAQASTRFLMLAATVAFAAAFGSFIGSVSGSGMVRYLSPGAAPPPAAASASATTSEPDARAIRQALAELATIKANLDNAARSTTSQFSKLADRLDRLDQRSAVPETTGTIAPAASPPAQPISAEAPKSNDRVLADWVVQDVQNGRALVESRFGGMFDVGTGSFLPGVGRVDAIKRQDGQWLVLTQRGTIVSSGR